MSKKTKQTENVKSESIVTAVGIRRTPEGYVSYTMKIQGDQVIEIEHDDPNLKAVALDQLKIRSVKAFWGDLDV